MATSTFDPTTCCLTDYSLQWLPRPSTRQHAIWWTTASSGYLDLRLDMLFYSLQWLHRPSTRQHADWRTPASSGYLDLRPDIMLFDRLQPPVATSTFYPTTCCLSDYSLQWLPRPSTRQHAVCQTTASSGYLDLRPDNMLFVRLQPPVATSTFDPTSCCLTDYSLQWLPRPSTRQHAVCQTTASSGYLDLRPDNMLFGRLQPPVATSTFDPTT